MSSTPATQLLALPIIAEALETVYLHDGNMTIIVGTQLLRVHASILSHHSLFFKTLWSNRPQTSPDSVRIHLLQEDARSITALIQSVYNIARPVSAEVLEGLLFLTDKLEFFALYTAAAPPMRDSYPTTLLEWHRARAASVLPSLDESPGDTFILLRSAFAYGLQSAAPSLLYAM
ncbi:hypothetical protein DXG01_000311 [Tephrocybe rancida]|nr:hypothetical protein DXG01_000311 [Tephrocybe rancida]